MFHYLQTLQRSMSRPGRRRHARLHPVSCEAFETRLVLSAVTPLSPIEQLPVDADNATTESAVAANRSAAQEFAIPSGAATQDDAVPRPQEISSPEFAAGQDNPPDFVTLPPDALDAVFGDLPPTGDIRHPGQPPRHGPPPSNSTVEDTTDSAFENAVDVTERAMSIESDEQPSAIAEQTDNADDVEAAFASPDGFVEIPRSATPGSSSGDLRLDSLNSNEAAGRSNLHTPFFDLSRDNEGEASDDQDSAMDAAMEFFNRQSEGGFIDAELDDLHAAAGIAGAHQSANLATSLESGLGRFNPFDDRSHTTMLTAVELRHDGESDNSLANNNEANTNLALASIVVGTVGVGSGSFSRTLDSLRKFLRRLGSVLGITGS